MELPDIDAVWRELIRAGVDRRHPWRVVALCTQGPDGPAGRHVILRRVGVDDRTLVFYTDARSGKVAELTACPRVALLLWDPGHRQQLRISGLAALEGDHALVEQHWAGVPEVARRDYASAAAPGTALGTEAPLDMAAARRHFTVVKVQVQSMDFLRLDRDAHRRARYDWRADRREWVAQSVVP